MSSLKEPHEQDAARMLSFLHGDDAHTFQTVPEGGQRQSAQILHGHLDKCIATLTELNTSGSGVFVCVNETDLKGRKSDNIIRVRALCADFDAPDSHRVEWLLSLSLPPNMIIESSPGKHHAYWVFNVGEISLTEFRPLQQRIAMVLGSDEKICDLSRVLRVAGFWHQKGEPFLTNICHIGDYYTTDQIKDFVWSLKSGSHSELDSHFQTSSEMLKLGDMPPHIKQAKHITTLWNTVAPLYSTNIEEIEEVLSFIPGDDRKIWVDVGIALRNSNFENAYDIWCRWSAKSDKYDTYEQQKNWDTFEGYNRVTLGKIYHLAAKHGYKRSSVDSLTCGQNSVLADVLDTPEVPAALDIHTVIGEIKKLAELTMIEYELKREGEAKRLGLRASKLDEFVKLYRRTDVKDVFFEEVSMWHEVVDGTVLLEEIENTIKKFIISEPHIATAAALWIVFTWCIDVMKIAPIACITAPEKRCGKTQLLHLIGRLVKRPQTVVSITTSALFRMISEYTPTLLIDEADTFIKDNEELRGILNGGHDRQSSYVYRTVGDEHKVGRFNVWGAKAISGIGHLPDTLRDRSILLELRRKKKTEVVERLRRAPEESFSVLRQKLCRWAEDNMDVLKNSQTSLPDELNDRAQDNWEPLLAIADCVGGNWGEKARQCALIMNSTDQDPQSVGESLLTDIKKVFDQRNVDQLSTDELIKGLCEDEASRWRTFDYGKAISPRQLANRLRTFRIKPCTVRAKSTTGKDTCKGYALKDFKDAFSSYLDI
ncbi:DUF3631 domain-containing protein [Acinetobacter baumannii]|uniref:DUF3631 domain-containing protein n=5 Tax=Acinetobacter baumannii TaxID=470 RepID=A0A8I0F9U1_ACIBA|nr:DUF3631 domain-containing protein [Acinetobacter baumannii]EHU2882663.1 DUF3631 domain-containing protein [Acinetobacter baumannii]EHU3107304.1 DUF3631 domain-containing protein [Acinetobacter baumannii]EHU3332428.1 DUF3631 domain-containing protein [Acinetobacter baumannii]MBD0189809.1 DUF3631 domain-containing protein [Acinetobacter baumannii]MBD0221815.1 DUF3631 domain-containing protein [Acinetobacter baumannii]